MAGDAQGQKQSAAQRADKLHKSAGCCGGGSDDGVFDVRRMGGMGWTPTWIQNGGLECAGGEGGNFLFSLFVGEARNFASVFYVAVLSDVQSTCRTSRQ